MNDSELERRLKAVPVPERSPEYWDEFPGAVMTQLGHASRPVRSTWRFHPRLAWALGFACFCLLMAFGFWQRNRPASAPSFALLQNEKVIRETLAMFPHQVRAIVQDARGTELILSDQPDVPSSTPLWIRICNGDECRVVITFSGQSLQIAREKVEVLADAQGQVMLVGDRLFWSATEKTPEAARLRIQARPIFHAL